MSITRRQFMRSIDGLEARLLDDRPLSAQAGAPQGRGGFQRGPAAPADAIQIGYNENPLGPSPLALEAIARMYGQAGRYPFNSLPSDADLAGAIAKKFGAKPAQVVQGTGSGELLRNAVRAFTTLARSLVVATPTYGTPATTARLIKTPLREVPVDAELRLDLDAMAAAAKGAGLVFVCNPNNPTATVHSAARITAFVDEVARRSPDTVVMIDEAYYDYVTDPGFATAAPLALARPNLLMLRTFSKAHGMAALRLGYAIGRQETIDVLARYRMPSSRAGETRDRPARPAGHRRRRTRAPAADRYWNAIVGNGGTESQCGWCKDRWGLSWQITPRVLTDALAAGGGEAKRAFEAMMTMKKIDIAAVEAARRG